MEPSFNGTKVIDGVQFDMYGPSYPYNSFIELLEKLPNKEDRKKLCEVILDNGSYDSAKYYLINTDPDYYVIDKINFTEILNGSGYYGFSLFDELKVIHGSEERKKYCEDRINDCRKDIEHFQERLLKEKKSEIEIWIDERKDSILIAEYYLNNINKNCIN